MPLPVSALLSLPEAVPFLGEATSENEKRVRAALREAGLAGAITATGCLHSSSLPDPAKYFAHPALNEREPVPPHEWGTTISWLESRIGRYDLVRLNRADIERWLAARLVFLESEIEASSRAGASAEASADEVIAADKKPPPGRALKSEVKDFLVAFDQEQKRAGKSRGECSAWVAARKNFPKHTITRDLVRRLRREAECLGKPGTLPKSRR